MTENTSPIEFTEEYLAAAATELARRNGRKAQKSFLRRFLAMADRENPGQPEEDRIARAKELRREFLLAAINKRWGNV